MRIPAVAMLIPVFATLAQANTPNPQSVAAPPQASSPSAPQSSTIVVPAGTRIPMSLASPIPAKSARPGTAVRAVTGFPVTVGTQLAIPSGTYVEGVIDKVVKGGRTGPELRMHFTRILYSNGYSLKIDGANVMAYRQSPTEREECEVSGEESRDREDLVAQTTLPPLPHTGPSMGTMIGIGIGITAAGIVTGLIYMHHLGARGAVLAFDAGWQFEMVLESPLSVDAATAAASASGH